MLHGARCAIFRERVPTIETLGEVLQRYRVSTLWLTASLFNVIVDEAPQILSGVRQLLTGGEALSPTHVRAALKRLPDVQLINGYGPTESTTFTCCYRIPNPLEETRLSIPIGRPICNTQVYVLDRYLSPVPLGVAGELYIGGDGLARGYLNRPELTAEKFLPDPFSAVPGARMYRTGDLVRYRPDGNIEFLGRIDHQVKIRGFRIELGEIEAVLAEHASVRQAVVLAREDAPGDKRLVAYIVPRHAAFADTDALRRWLREHLPDYMLPSAYVVLERLPLTPNGKVDRRALPAPQYGRTALANAFVAPRNSLEEVVAEVWCEVLKLERVGVHDSFFELGGHSLLAAQVVARLAKLLQVELPLRRLFEAPTVSDVAAEAEKMLGAGEPRRSAPIVAVPRTGDLPLSFAQQRLWFLDRLLPARDTYNIPTAWRLRGRLDAPALQRSLEELVARHETLRTTFALNEGQPVQVIGSPQSIALEVTDLGALLQAEREACALEIADTEARQPFDLEAGPLLRAQLLRLAPEEHLLLLNVHHIISDGWSAGIFERELSSAYNAFVSGRELRLPELPIQYADYALWQREWLQGEVLEAQLAYWKAQLADLPTLTLPTDRPRPAVMSYRGARAAFDLPEPLSHSLKALGRREGATLFMTLLAAFQVLLYRYSGQEDIAVGAPIAGRRRSELEPLIGFFANTLVLRVDLSGNPRFRELLARVRESALGAYTHQDLPFEKLVEELAPARDLSRNPLFQVMFVLQNAPGSALALEGVQVSRLPLETHTAKFDLSLSVRETAEGLRASWEFSTDLFDAQTIERMARHFERLLEGIVADPAATHRRAAAAHRGRAPPAAGGVERHGGRLSQGSLHPRAVRGAGRTHARGGGGGVRGPATHLCRAQRARQPPGAPPHRAWGGARGVGGCVHRALDRDGGGVLGDPEGRRSLRAARSDLSVRAINVHVEGRGHSSADRPGTADRQVRSRWSSDRAHRSRLAFDCRRSRATGGGELKRRAVGVRDLHVRLHREAERSDGDAPGGGAARRQYRLRRAKAGRCHSSGFQFFI